MFFGLFPASNINIGLKQDLLRIKKHYLHDFQISV